ncbi:hypothetical protein PUP68_32555 [Pseudomonas chlororaphis]|uniref:hypothetical protein n=1 Tax=Pseudomonas chlororaphis TaxID=587753 RepID=UPI002368503A|nr:hypothetical protein [Pseudomonas chlororaphis]WDG81447.1 hypothetical protein PUP77_12305 [Pseudomonas chlororaphis]WDG85500.1 hypothetical protein PUP68_32555 [Pseudomonas chlororaphis]
MPIRVDLLALEPNAPGQARLTVKKWQGSPENLEFSIQRNQDAYYLQNGQKWSNNPYWFQISRFDLDASGETLQTQVGMEVVDPLLEGSANSNFQIELREQGPGFSDKGVVRPGAGLLPSTAGGQTRSTYDAGHLASPTAADSPEIPQLPELTLPEPEPAPDDSRFAINETEPLVQPPVPVKKNRWIWPLLLILVLLVAAAAWFWMQKAEAPAPATAAPAPAAEAGACTLESMNGQPELTFVQACIKAAPASAQLLEIINLAKTNNHCGVAQRLYANRAQAGDLQIASAYAHEYDPKYHKASSCFAEPDKATAAYWYETILSHEPDNAEAKQRFEELQK